VLFKNKNATAVYSFPSTKVVTTSQTAKARHAKLW
jgi:hypothetical protein